MNTKLSPDPLLLLRRFMRQGAQVASITPSSHNLAQALCAQINPAYPQVILELGAGMGAVTRIALEQMHPRSKLLIVEKNADFVRILRHHYPRAEVIEADVAHTNERLYALGIHHVDLVLSSLPIASLPHHVNQQIFACVRDVAYKGWFSQLTMMLRIYRGLYHRLFHEVTFATVWRNLPPGGVYHCRQLRDSYMDALR